MGLFWSMQCLSEQNVTEVEVLLQPPIQFPLGDFAVKTLYFLWALICVTSEYIFYATIVVVCVNFSDIFGFKHVNLCSRSDSILLGNALYFVKIHIMNIDMIVSQMMITKNTS